MTVRVSSSIWYPLGANLACIQAWGSWCLGRFLNRHRTDVQRDWREQGHWERKSYKAFTVKVVKTAATLEENLRLKICQKSPMCMLERNNVIKSSVSPGLFKIGQTFTMDVRVSSLEHCMCPSCSICFCFGSSFYKPGLTPGWAASIPGLHYFFQEDRGVLEVTEQEVKIFLQSHIKEHHQIELTMLT